MRLPRACKIATTYARWHRISAANGLLSILLVFIMLCYVDKMCLKSYN